MDSPLVSIACVTYNHAAFIRQCLDGFVMQKTDFPVEALIHDDVSTDGTADIIREYEQKYPDLIKPIYQTENQWSKGVNVSMFNYSRVRGKYLAMCEGDDYWTDPRKLQKQVDFMEAHPEVSLSCHPYETIKGTNQECRVTSRSDVLQTQPDGFFFTQEYAFCHEWITKTCTSVYRYSALNLEFIAQFKLSRDVHLVYGALAKGKGYYFSFVGAVYREHAGGIFSSLSYQQQLLTNSAVFRELYQVERSPLSAKILYGSYAEVVRSQIKEGQPIAEPENEIEMKVFFEMSEPYRLGKKLLANKLFRLLYSSIKHVCRLWRKLFGSRRH
ncbi:glycosyl transferase [Planctomycetales bacterium]|nr:glycosyl transferase [Planctomycetales bacterium]